MPIPYKSQNCKVHYMYTCVCVGVIVWFVHIFNQCVCPAHTQVEESVYFWDFRHDQSGKEINMNTMELGGSIDFSCPRCVILPCVLNSPDVTLRRPITVNFRHLSSFKWSCTQRMLALTLCRKVYKNGHTYIKMRIFQSWLCNWGSVRS